MALPSMSLSPVGQVQAVLLTDAGVRLLDQTSLPHQVMYQTIQTVLQMVDAIQRLVVRGAPAIGVAGAFGLVLSARANMALDQANFYQALLADADTLAQARPTAVNLQWAIDRLKAVLENLKGESNQTILHQLTEAANGIFEEDVAMCQAIGVYGKALIPKGAGILTHCNAGALATAGYGTALGVVRAVFADDPSIMVYADETRPRLQGAKLTVWELQQENIPVTLISDNMSAWLMKQGKVDVVIVGADRIAANGDAANKIGTYLLALAAKAHGIPFYVAAPSSTIDFALQTGDQIPIELRDGDELRQVDDALICDPQTLTYNPAFDVTPHHLIAAIITETGVHYPPFEGHWS